MEWATEQWLVRGFVVGALEIQCAPAALLEREAFLEGLLAVYEGRLSTLQELPKGTGWARFTPENVGCWRFPVERRSDLDRAVSKLTGDWWKKFYAETTPNLLVIRGQGLFAAEPATLQMRIETAVQKFKEAMHGLEMVSTVLIYDEIFWQPPRPASVLRSDFRLAVGAADGCARAVLLVPNPVAATPFQENELDVLVGPNMLWWTAKL